MWGSSLEFEHVFPAALLCVVVVTFSARAQSVPPAMWSSSQLSDAPSTLVRVARSEPSFQKDQTVFVSASTLRLDEHGTDHARTGIADGSLTFVPSFSRVQPKALHSADDWQHYGYRIPLVGAVVLRVGKQAQAHPRVASVFKVIQPQF